MPLVSLSRRDIVYIRIRSVHSQKYPIQDTLESQHRRRKPHAVYFNPDDATTLSNRSLCYLLMGDKGKALADANQCRRLQPDWPKACYRQGVVLMSLKDYEGASERFLDGLKLDPGSAEIEDALREAMESLRTYRSTRAK